MTTQTNKFSILKSMFPYIIIAIMAIIIFLQQHPTHINNSGNPPSITVNGHQYNVQKHVIDTQYIPMPPKIVYKPGNVIRKDSIVYVTVPVGVDTVNILKDYFAKKIYLDTLHLPDSVGYVSLKDTISKNSILSRTWESHTNKMLVSDTIYISPVVKNQWYIGGLIGAYTPNTSIAGVSLLIKNKKDRICGISSGYTSNLNMFVQGTMLWKIKIKK